MDISGLESLVRNHPVFFIFGALSGAYMGAFSLFAYLTKRKMRNLKKEIGELEKEARFYIGFLKDTPLLEDSKIRAVYNRGLELTGNC